MSRYYNFWYVISGFMQHTGTRTRLADLWDALYNKYPSTSLSVVKFCPWNTNWDHEAEFVLRHGCRAPCVRLVGYSWGAGWGSIQFCKQLQKRGLTVNRMVLIDPVYRHNYRCGNWRAFAPWQTIWIPSNVRGDVYSFHQKTDWPRGHKLKARVPDLTKVYPSKLIENVGHQFMDDQEDIMDECLELVG